MTEYTPNNPTLIPANDIDQIKVNVNTRDNNFRNVAIPGRIQRKEFLSNLWYLVEPVIVPPQTDVSSFYDFFIICNVGSNSDVRKKK